MRIGIDIRCLEEGRRTGVEEYTLNLLANLFSIDKENEYVLFFNSFKKPDFDLSWTEKYPNVRVKFFRFPNKFLNFCFWYFDRPFIDRMIGRVDLFFMPNISFGAFTKKVKLVTTVHDLSFEYYPETFSWKRRLWHVFVNPRKLCKRANKIITVSRSTADDLKNLYKISSNKIEVIYSGVDESFKTIDRNDIKLIEIKEKYGLPYKFILFLSTIEPRKNIVGLVRAYNQMRKIKNSELDKYKLVIAGSPGWKQKEIISEISQSEFSKDILLIGEVDDADKVYLYNLAMLFVYPSFFEGFGFPPLEAMKCKTIVLASNNSSLPEVVGEGGIQVDPKKPDEIFRAMKEILLDKNLQSKLRDNGTKQSQKFNWQKTAEEFLKVIDKVGK